MHLLSQTSIQKGDEVLIYGASGSIGTMAVQLAKIAGANVTAVCSGKNFDLVKSLGSDRVIDYTLQGSEKQLSTYKYVLDAVGNSKSSILKEKSKKALHVNGKYISIDKDVPKTPISAFLQLKNYLAEGKIKPLSDRVFPLEKMAEAHDYVELGHKRGNVIISVTL
jgi:alcohol dehydrogenase